MATVCDSCLEAFAEEGADEELVEAGALELGADIADHLCDWWQREGEVDCDCPCNAA